MKYYEIDETVDNTPKIGDKIKMKISKRIGVIKNIIFYETPHY